MNRELSIIVSSIIALSLAGCNGLGDIQPVSPEIPAATTTAQSEEAENAEVDSKESEQPQEEQDTKDVEPAEENKSDPEKNMELFQQFLNNQIKVDDKTYGDIFGEIVDSFGVVPENYYYDVDEDGEDELLTDSIYGFEIFDVRDGQIYLLASGNGTADMCRVYQGEGHTYVAHFNYGSVGWEDLELIRYNGDGEEVESILLYAEYPGDSYTEDGSYTLNDKEITMDEYKKYMESYTMVPLEEMKQVEDNKDDNKIIDAYVEYYEKHFPPNDYGGYSVAFVCLDEDDIPEMLVKANFDMGEVTALQYDEGKIHDLGSYVTLEYIPHSNELVNSWSDGETNEDVLMKIMDHKITNVGGRSSIYWGDSITKYYSLDENGNETEITRDEYDNYFKNRNNYGEYTSSNNEQFYNSAEEASVHIP